jgi:cation diffusion facilitator family transporter
MAGRTRTVIYAAIAGNLLVALTKFAAAGWTGSAAMVSEGVHSVVDAGNEALLLYGMRRAARPPDRSHPLGHGRELYFWSFIVAVLIFAVGAGVSLLEGIVRILDPRPISDPMVNYVVIGLSFVFEGATWWIALKEFRRTKGSLGLLAAVRQSKNPPKFIILLEDTAALIGLAIALAGTLAAVHWQASLFDGLASIAIGALLAATASLLARESKDLLIGERAHPSVARSILRLAREEPGVAHAHGVITVHLGPHQIVAALSVEFADDMTAPQIEAAVEAIEKRIRQGHPDITTLFVKPQTAHAFSKAREWKLGAA